MNAFSQCESLTNLDLGNSVKEIGTAAFQYCGIRKLHIPNSVTTLGNYAFSNTKLTEVLFDKSLITEIVGGLFSDCNKLRSIELPNSITTIGDRAFSNCSALKEITIPASVTSIGEEAFALCDHLYSIIAYPMDPPTCSYSAFNNVDKYDCILRVPHNSIDKYEQADVWKDFSYIESMSPAHIYVRLTGGEMQLSEAMTGLRIMLRANDTYEFHSAMLNDEDVTDRVDSEGYYTIPEVSEDAILNIVFKKADGTTGTSETDISSMKVTVYDNVVDITGKPANESVRAYDLKGMLLKDTTESRFVLDYQGIVIMQIGTEIYKFAI